MNERSKGLVNCRYLVGIGHLTRSLNICRSLLKFFDIDLLVGGFDVNLSLDSPHLRKILLPAVGPQDLASLPESKKLPLPNELIDGLNNRYDFFITELFPFSKWDFKDEVVAIIDKIKKRNPACKVVCSLRDSMPPAPPETDRRILNFLNQYYDRVFLHVDPRIFLLDESFSLVEELGDKLIYTGFINNPDADIKDKQRKKRVVVSTGAGSFGEELFYAAVEVAPFFPDYEFALITGPKTSAKVEGEIKLMAKKVGAENISIHSLVKNFQEYLSESALSISLGGYTIMDIVYTKTPAIVLPSTFHDQYARGIKFAAFGFLKLISMEDLATDRLCNAITEALVMATPPFDVDMSGSQTTCKEIGDLLGKKLYS